MVPSSPFRKSLQNAGKSMKTPDDYTLKFVEDDYIDSRTIEMHTGKKFFQHPVRPGSSARRYRN